MNNSNKVLFTLIDSNYNKIGLDCWDINKNALLCPDREPCIYHPPCATWGRLRKFANNYPGEHLLSVWSIFRIWRYGGILEHPAGSLLWKLLNLPLPGSKYDFRGGFSISIDQHWFGHKCKKNTWLYIKGCKISDLPPMPLNFALIKHTVSGKSKNCALKEISKKNRQSTPIELAIWLNEVLNIIKSKSESII